MKRYALIAFAVLSALTVQAQREFLQIEMQDGTTRSVAVDQIKQMSFITQTETLNPIPYENYNLSGFLRHKVTLFSGEVNDPWSVGSSYAMATGYQKWDGTVKSNKEANGYLISPLIDTHCPSGKVKLCFDYCVAYPQNDIAFDSHIKVFISKDAEHPWNDADWHELDWTPKHVSTTWDHATEEIELPEKYVNAQNVRFAFWFYAPANGSCTFEVNNFKVEECEKSTTNPITTQGTQEDPFTVADALKFINALPADQNTTESYYIKGYVTSFRSGEEPGNIYGNATYYIADTKGGEPTFMVYRGMYFGGKKFTSAEQLKIDDEVIICASLVNYKGNHPETVSGKAQIYSLNGKVEEVGGGDNPGPGPQTGEGLTITREGSTVTMTDSKVTAGTATVEFDFGTLGDTQDNATEVEVVTLSDGTTIAFDKADNVNQPKYYAVTKGVRVYGGNSIVITGQKKIASITWTCDTNYTGADTLSATADGNVITIQNGATGYTQFRIQAIKVTYAK